MFFFPQRVTITKSVSPLWQHRFERGLDERLKAWIASPENAENIQKQLSCCLPSHPLKSPACLTTSPARLPTSSLEATCSSTMPSCFSVLSLRYHNLLIALLGLSHFSMKSWFPSYNQIQHNVYFIKMDLLSKSKQRMAVNIHTPPDPVIHVKENLFLWPIWQFWYQEVLGLSFSWRFLGWQRLPSEDDEHWILHWL